MLFQIYINDISSLPSQNQKTQKFLKKKITITPIHNPELTTVNMLVCSLLDFIYSYTKIDFYEIVILYMLLCMYTHMLQYIVILYMIFSLNNLLWISFHVSKYRSMPLFSIALQYSTVQTKDWQTFVSIQTKGGQSGSNLAHCLFSYGPQANDDFYIFKWLILNYHINAHIIASILPFDPKA